MLRGIFDMARIDSDEGEILGIEGSPPGRLVMTGVEDDGFQASGS